MSGLGADRRSARPYDLLLRAFLKARGWRGGRRALLDALSEGGRLDTPEAFAATLDRIGLRARWRWTFAGLLTAGDLPAIARTRQGPLLLTRLDDTGRVLASSPHALRTERPAPARTPMRVLVVDAIDDRCRSSVQGAMLGLGDDIARAAALTAPVALFAALAPVLAQAATAGAGAATIALLALGAAAFAARWARDGVLARGAVRLEHRLAGVAAERALHHVTPEPSERAAVDRFAALPAAVARGVAGALFDIIPVVCACLGALAIGGPGAIAPLFAALALGLIVLAARDHAAALAADDTRSNALVDFRRTDHAITLTAAAQALVGCVAAIAVASWAATGRPLPDLAGHLAGLALAAAPLLLLARETRALCDAVRAFASARALEFAPEERRRLTRLALKTPAAVTLRDVVAPSLDGLDATIRIPALSLAGGDVIAVTGEPGAGARTLLATLAGVAPMETGGLLVGGRDLRRVDLIAYRSEIGFVGRRVVTPPGVTALDLVRRLAPFADESAACAAFERVGLARLGVTPLTIVPAADLAADDPAIAPVRLRLALAGALARRPPLLLLDLDDEALAHDSTGETLLAEIAAALRGRTTILMATTRPALLRQADMAVEMARGRVIAVGAPAPAPAPTAAVVRFAAFGRA